MSEPQVDISQLDESQQLALQTYTSVTDQEPSVAIPLLERSQWNVQIAITKFLDGERPDPVAEARAALSNNALPASSRHVSNLHDDLYTTSSRPLSPHNDLTPAPRIVPQPSHQVNQQAPLPLSLILAPFNLLYRIFSWGFTVFSHIFPFLPRLLASMVPRSRPTPTRRSLSPKDTALRFIREFEEEYHPSPETIPPFYENGYAQALDSAKSSLKFLLVILISPEHDNTPSFTHNTLLSPTVTNFLRSPPSPGLITWAGTLQDSEAYQISSTLKATTSPFAALIVHTPQVSSSRMSVVCRIEGPTSPDAFVAKLRSAMATHTPALERIRSQRAEQQAARTLREEQNSAYERSLAIDRERARQKREAEEAAAAVEKAALEKQRLEEEEGMKREHWRRWRAKNLASEPGNDVKNIVRVSLRMPDGQRVIRKFAADQDVEEVYAFVECYPILQQQENSDEEKNTVIGDTETDKPPEDYEHEYKFRLVSPMPRTVYDVQKGGAVEKVIGRNANLIVETIEVEDDESEED
ncbi:MAG: hypothetical protein M1834_007487 [Cirrosporium novae-zelandiae]|nr:MAG: hypothetical protein M1834_007487 [Cirrosporium novae-zelandiae]